MIIGTKESEKWKEHKEFPNYLFSNTGKIHSLYVNRVMKLHPDGSGYLHTGLVDKKGERKTKKVHRLVAELFIKNAKKKPCVNHINGNKENNRVENLEWCTYSENNNHAYNLRLNHSGQDHTNSKLKNKDIQEIKAERKKGTKFKEIAKRFKVSTTTIYKVVNNTRYVRI